ncbi:MAG: hypothetical protein K2Q21_13180 [Chitinophagaceae bacterium]|nr:hypothetical protein [Chitinophagaceae bacterium]
MFSSYTWSSFFEYIGIIVVTYFFILGYALYKKDISHFIFSKQNKSRDTIETPVRKPDLLPMVHELVSELGLVIRNASEKKPALSELQFALKQKIKDFLILESTEYKGKINLYIEQELAIRGIHGILPEEIEQLWKSP